MMLCNVPGLIRTVFVAFCMPDTLMIAVCFRDFCFPAIFYTLSGSIAARSLWRSRSRCIVVVFESSGMRGPAALLQSFGRSSLRPSNSVCWLGRVCVARHLSWNFGEHATTGKHKILQMCWRRKAWLVVVQDVRALIWHRLQCCEESGFQKCTTAMWKREDSHFRLLLFVSNDSRKPVVNASFVGISKRPVSLWVMLFVAVMCLFIHGRARKNAFAGFGRP